MMQTAAPTPAVSAPAAPAPASAVSSTLRAIPTLSPALARQLPGAVVLAGLAAAAGMALLIVAQHRPEWWAAYQSASIVGIVSMVVSVLILRQLAGKPVDTAVLFVMAASGIRMGVSLVGLLIVTHGLQTPGEAVGFMICGYYAAMLIAETTLLYRATRVSSGIHGVSNA
ncbi:MAG: hypothetical protein ACTHM6_18020 [Tepidisphaeraceae bacterium]